MREQISRSVGDLRVEYTSKPVSGWGGLEALARFFRRARLREFLVRALPDGRISNNRIDAVDMVMQFIAAILVGASRFEHVERVRWDAVVQQIFGIVRMASASSITRYFGGFLRSQCEHLHWTVNRLIYSAIENTGDVLDLDSSVFSRWGDQEGSERGYNPKRRGGKSHHPLLAMLAESKLIVHAWMRGGAASTFRGCCQFLTELLENLPPTFRIRALRADSGFYSDEFLSFLEDRGIPYAIPMKMSRGVVRWCASERVWTQVTEEVTEEVAITEDIYTSPKHHKPRRVVIMRTIKREKRGLFTVEELDYRVIVTSLADSPVEVWRFYNRRGDCENRIKELKYDFNAEGFCLQKFNGTDTAFRLVCLTYNLVSLFKTLALKDPKIRLGNIRDSIFVVGAIAGSEGGRRVLRLGLQNRWREEFDSLLDRVSQASISTAAQLLKLLTQQAEYCPTPWRNRTRPKILGAY